MLGGTTRKVRCSGRQSEVVTWRAKVKVRWWGLRSVGRKAAECAADRDAEGWWIVHSPVRGARIKLRGTVDGMTTMR